MVAETKAEFTGLLRPVRGDQSLWAFFGRGGHEEKGAKTECSDRG